MTDNQKPILSLKRKKRVIKLAKPVSKVSVSKTAKPKPKKAPSQLRTQALLDALGKHSKAFRSHKPMALDLEKQVFKFVADNHLSASKRVVKALIKKHTSAKNYLLAMQMEAPRYNLSDSITEDTVSWEQASIASKLLVKVEAKREAEKVAKRLRNQRKKVSHNE